MFVFSHSYTGQDFSVQGNAGKISLDQIDSVSVVSSSTQTFVNGGNIDFLQRFFFCDKMGENVILWLPDDF